MRGGGRSVSRKICLGSEQDRDSFALFEQGVCRDCSMGDLLCLGKIARINFPSTVSTQNWSYRFEEKDFSGKVWTWLKKLAEKYGRGKE